MSGVLDAGGGSSSERWCEWTRSIKAERRNSGAAGRFSPPSSCPSAPPNPNPTDEAPSSDSEPPVLLRSSDPVVEPTVLERNDLLREMAGDTSAEGGIDLRVWAGETEALSCCWSRSCTAEEEIGSGEAGCEARGD